jgi:hypothetical protein
MQRQHARVLAQRLEHVLRRARRADAHHGVAERQLQRVQRRHAGGEHVAQAQHAGAPRLGGVGGRVGRRSTSARTWSTS